MGASQADRQRRRQKKLAKARAKSASRAVRSRHFEEVRVGPRAVPAEASKWPIRECLVDPSYRDRPALSTVVVARSAPDGRIAVASFLVDLGCLGAKNGFAAMVSTGEYEAIRDRAFARDPERCDLALAAKIVRSGIAYAERLGFRPHPDVLPALALLGPELACDVDVPVGGPDGVPCYLSGPDDDPERVIRQLTVRLGAGGFRSGDGSGYLLELDDDFDVRELDGGETAEER